ncbi:MAG: hypothetical protein GY719_17840 [bacterium]|nr:hypothetical protein [bacterium]
MKNLGYLLIAIGFLASAYLATKQQEGVPWPWYLSMLAVGAVGVTMARWASHKQSRDVELVSANIGAIGSSLENIVEKARAFDRDKETIDVYELRHHIDREFPDDLDTFVQARQSIAHSFGLQSYADVMNPFAAGERYLNRVWSTSTDGYIDEAHTYVTKAREQFEEALEIFRGLEKP